MPKIILNPILQPTRKQTHGLDKQPHKRKAIIDTINPSMFVATTTNFTGSLMLNCPFTFNITITPKTSKV